MPRISTIANPAYNPVPPNLLSRAAALFKRDLPYRFLNFINCKCKVAAPRGGDRNSPEYREQAYLRKLSKGRMNPLDAMLGLVRVTEIEGHKPFCKLEVSTYQARRMLDNLSQESIPVLSQHIQKIEKNFREKGTVSTRQEGPTPQEADHLEFLKKLRDNHKCLAEKLMACARYEEEFLNVGDDDKVSALKSALNKAWNNSPEGNSPSDLIQKEIVQCKDQLRGSKGTKEQQKFAVDLHTTKDTFKNHQVIATDALTKILTQALRKVGAGDPAIAAQRCVDQFMAIPKHRHAALLPPLLEAMSDVIDGVGSARLDLAQARKDIGLAAQAAKETQRHIAALDKIAASVARRFPASDNDFEKMAQEHLGALPREDKVFLMVHLDTIKSNWKPTLIQNALRNLANTWVLDTINEYFVDLCAKNLDDMVEKVASLKDNDHVVIADFFDRFPWIPEFFEELSGVNKSSLPLAVILKDLNELSHLRSGRAVPTSRSKIHEMDWERYLGIFRQSRGGAWDALYTFFGIPDEPAELPG